MDDQSDLNKSLHDALSLESRASTSDTSPQESNSDAFRKIGAGACGAIFAQDEQPYVFKLAKSPDPTEVWNDYVKHDTIARAFQQHNFNDVTIPACHFFVPSDRHSFWVKQKPLLDAARDVCNLPTAALVTERIPPLPHKARELLINKYCSPSIQDAARVDLANRDCLVRPYLGYGRGKVRQILFSLRNFKLHLNYMVGLQLETEDLARRMAKTLAVMHWGAKTDVRDVEFVLGSSTTKRAPKKPFSARDFPPCGYTGPPTDNIGDFFCRETKLFVLDFNRVRDITMDDEGVAMAVEAWRLNDPYYPKPFRESNAEEIIWEAFVSSYLATSEQVLRNDLEGCDDMVLGLPQKFIMGITEVERARLEARKGSEA
ncbi:zinc finger protein-domain-containing protein [Podospora aff. communis PSN243]|uniref:Zinc finger protein-domain-containing protein n=1 Tax=Podospora aff. communis PSN243 TaxID=3040156 RepID=A0AAV9GYH6_9PEZI|nr:zinc finger protein-domain-containing protein [Podospora aff. communis PSN243]